VSRPVPAACEICAARPPTSGVGFPAWPGAVKGLPAHLRGACLWICPDPGCDLAAQKRAALAAASAGLRLKTIWRHWRPDTPKGPRDDPHLQDRRHHRS